MNSSARSLIAPFYAACLFLILWEAAGRALAVPIYVFPTPTAIWSYAVSLDPAGHMRWLALWTAGVRTFTATVLGFGIAVILGIAIGTTLAAVTAFRRGVYPLANLLQMVPVIALAPLLNIWFGHGIKGVSASAAIVAIFPMIANTVDGLRSGDPKLRELFTIHGASGWQRWRYLDLPSALPNIFTGMKVSAGLSVIGAVVGELVSGVINHPPIGALIAQGLRNSNLPLVFGAVLTSACIGFLIFGCVALAEKMVVSQWHGLSGGTQVGNQTKPLGAGYYAMFTLLPIVLLTGVSLLPAQTKQSVQADDESVSSELKRIRIQLNWIPDPQFGGFYAAKHLGYFKETGLEVEVIQGGPGVATPQMVATGEVEFAIVGGDQVLSTRAQGAPIVAVYAAYNVYPRAFMVHDSSPYQSLESLWQSDSTVAVEPGLPFVKWMQQTYDGTELTLVPSGGGLAEFQRDQKRAQAVFVISEPVTMAQRNVPVRIFPVADSGYNPYTVVLTTNENFLKRHEPVVQKVVNAVRRGWAAYLDDPTPINREMAKLNLDMSMKAMNLGAQKAEPYVRMPAPLVLGEMTEKRWQDLAGQLRAVGVLDETELSLADCFRNVALPTKQEGGTND